MSRPVSIALGVAALLLPTGLVLSWVTSADARLEAASQQADDETAQVAVAQADERGYCNAQLKTVLRRVLTSCGLVGADGATGRGCQPADARTVATMEGEDFNALFMPLADRAAIVQFDKNSSELDPADRSLVDSVFAERGGASWFLVVSRASPEGSVDYNRQLSEARGQAVLAHIQQTFPDPELAKEVGVLWLGEEFAQLDADFCDWRRSDEACSPDELNRSAFVTWIDCRI